MEIDRENFLLFGVFLPRFLFEDADAHSVFFLFHLDGGQNVFIGRGYDFAETRPMAFATQKRESNSTKWRFCGLGS